MLTVQFWGISFCLNFGRGSAVQRGSAPILYPSYRATRVVRHSWMAAVQSNGKMWEKHSVKNLKRKLPVAPGCGQIAAAPFITQI